MKADTARRPLLPMRQCVRTKVPAAAMPDGVEQLADGCLDALVGAGRDQLGAARATKTSLHRNAVQNVKVSGARYPTIAKPSARYGAS
jgi:hypothetical protein